MLVLHALQLEATFLCLKTLKQTERYILTSDYVDKYAAKLTHFGNNPGLKQQQKGKYNCNDCVSSEKETKNSRSLCQFLDIIVLLSLPGHICETPFFPHSDLSLCLSLWVCVCCSDSAAKNILFLLKKRSGGKQE